MTSGNGAERSGGQPAVGPSDGVLDDSADDFADDCVTESAAEPVDGEDTTVDPAPEASADRPPTGRRKAGVRYRPV